MKWLYLSIAISCEICGTTFMKLSDGFARPLYTALMVVFYIGCFIGLTLTVKAMEVSTAYAIWSGVGVAILSLIGIFFFHESVTPLKVAGLLAIVAGVVALRLSGAQ